MNISFVTIRVVGGVAVGSAFLAFGCLVGWEYWEVSSELNAAVQGGGVNAIFAFFYMLLHFVFFAMGVGVGALFFYYTYVYSCYARQPIETSLVTVADVTYPLATDLWPKNIHLRLENGMEGVYNINELSHPFDGFHYGLRKGDGVAVKYRRHFRPHRHTFQIISIEPGLATL